MTASSDFVSWMRDEVDEWADRYGCQPHRAFPAWAMAFVFDVSDDDAFNQTDTLSQGDAGLDGWHFDRDASVFHLVQAKYLGDPVGGLVEPGTLDSLIRAALLLRDPSRVADGPHRERLGSVAAALEEAVLANASITLDFFVAGRVSSEAKQQLTVAVSELGSDFSVEIYDSERLEELKVADDPIADLAGQEVQFEVALDSGHFAMDGMEIPGVEAASVTAIDARSLADAVERWQARLFKGNVRYYLRRVNRVNRKMLATLADQEERQAFWLYNNGLTIVADSYRFSEDNGRTSLVAVNPQIVNGAQTSSVIRERRAHLARGDAAVQCRIIAISDDAAGRAALERISEFTNSQSPVRAGDLRSNAERHRKLQSRFGMLPEPVFYERRRGEWQSLTPAQRSGYRGGKVTKEQIGQRYLAFRGRPAEAVTNKDAMFGDMEPEAFDLTTPAHVYMLASLLFDQADSLLKASQDHVITALVPSLSLRVSNDEGAPSYLEALRRARSLVCSHAVALAHEVLRWRYSDIGPQRAQALRALFASETSAARDFVWRMVFQAIRLWLYVLEDKTSLRARLQRRETFQVLVGGLQDQLVGEGRERLPTLQT